METARMVRLTLALCAVCIGAEPALGQGGHTHESVVYLRRGTLEMDIDLNNNASGNFAVACDEGDRLLDVQLRNRSAPFFSPDVEFTTIREDSADITIDGVVESFVLAATVAYVLVCLRPATEETNGHSHTQNVTVQDDDVLAALEDGAPGDVLFVEFDGPSDVVYVASGANLPDGWVLRGTFADTDVIRRLWHQIEALLEGPRRADEDPPPSQSVFVAATTDETNGHSHAVSRDVVERDVRVPGLAGSGKLKRRKTTVKCPKGTRAISPGYSPGFEVDFELVSAEIKPRRRMRKIKFTYDIEKGGFVKFSAICLGRTVE